MLYLVDTNVLLQFADREHPLHAKVRAVVRTLRTAGHSLRATPQNCVEFWNVATRPIDKNGFGLLPADADKLLRLGERLFPVLPDSPAMYPQWRQLVVLYDVSGVQVHDDGDIQTETVFDRTHDRYLLVNIGWDNGQRIHGTLIHADIIDGKLWIQRDGTEHGIAKKLVRAGVPKDHIVSGFRPVEVRRYTLYVAA